MNIISDYSSIVIKIIGIYALFWWCLEHLTSVFEYVYNSVIIFIKFRNNYLQKEFGRWAVVTGATDGIGKYYVIELAKRGINTCLISRNEVKLFQLSQEIEKAYKVCTKLIVADFSNGQSIYEEIKSQLEEIDIGILINNVGTHQFLPDNLENISEEMIWNIINVNVGAITLMSKIVIPNMKSKKRGLILNVSSGSQFMPLPLSVVYGATKSYTRSFSLALKKELASYNVKVHIIIPLFVKTNITHYSKTPEIGTIFFPNAETYVKSAIKLLGKCSHTSGYIYHSIQFTLVTTIPETFRIFIAHILYKGFRKQYFDKQKKKNINTTDRE